MENNKFVLSSLAILSVVLIVIVLIFYIKSLNQNQVINEYRELKNENTNLIREKERMKKLLSFKPSDNKNIFESSSVLIKNMMNTQNESNYNNAKNEMKKFSSSKFMDKFFKDRHQQYNLPINTKITDIKYFNEDNSSMNDKKIVIATLTRKAYEIDGTKITDKVIATNNMVIKVNFKNTDGKWLIDDFKVIGDIPIGEEK
ncbi:hypothetical protein E1N08_12670 [Staphylococcus epidermidis]|uniref:hypothetical protein n=1 Tax=Staphylococcus epidermidis TaxID=1282 RepID=UPI0010672250|nr:hypothetical protein [Staphylococcus epidermidis]TES17882.1 hypothetical protein E1N08_12670 [Staphylococcus epidermidis]